MQQQLSGETARPSALLKRSLPFISLALVLSVLYFAPQLPIVRAWLLSFVTAAAETAGYNVRIDKHSGNPWSGLSLEDVAVSGPGLNVSIDELAASYYLPGLITRQLPLSLSAEGVRGDITLSEFESSDSSGGSAVITPVLRRLSLRDVALKATDVPYTLPDITLSELEARSNGNRPISATALLTTPEGSMNVEGTLNLSPFEIIANVPRADVRIARQWWDGIEGGTLSGQFRYQDGKIETDAVVAGGEIAFLGETVTELSGPVRMRYPIIDANLSGQTLGGTVEATGGVDIDALRWFGEATGQVALRDTALWLAEGRLPLDLSVIPMTGRADAQVRASGWTSVNVSGVAQGAGSLATYPLENLLVDFEYDTETATRATITGDLAGGNVTSQLIPTPEGYTFDLNAQDMALLETVFADVTIGLTQDGILSGPTTASLDGSLLGEPVDLQIGGDLTPERWFLPVTGTAFAGPFEGDITLADGVLSGNLVGSDLDFSFLDGPITLALEANGPPTDLPLTLSLRTLEPTRFAFGPVRVAETLEGSLTALLRGSLLDDVQGNFGPISFQGQTLLSGQTGELSYVVNETKVSGPLEDTFSADNGSLTLQNRNLLGEADLSSSELALPGLTLEPLEASLRYRFDETWNVSLADTQQGLEASYTGGKLELSTSATQVTVAGQDLTLTGDAAADASAVLETLRFDLLGLTNLGDVALVGDANEASFELSSEPGSGGFIDAATSLKGSLRLREGTGQFTGRLGELDLFGSGDFAEGDLRADLTARSGDDTLNLKLAGATNNPALTLTGTLPLRPVGDLFNFELSGQIAADLVQDESGYRGAATISTEIANIPADLVVQGTGDRLELSGEARPLAIPVALNGTLQPTLELTGTSDYGDIQLFQENWQLAGSGTIPELSRAGFELGAQSWQVGGSLSDRALSLSLPASNSAAQLSWGEGGWQVNADLNQTVSRADAVLTLNASAGLSAEDRAGAVDGVLRVASPNSSDTLAISGTLEAMQVEGTLPAVAVSDLLASPVNLQGDIALDAQVNLLDGAAYKADAIWQTNADSLVASVQGKGAELTASASAKGLEFDYANGTLNVQTDSFNPSAFIALPSVRGAVSGAFSVTPGQANHYDGTLSLTTSEPADTRILLTGAGAGLQLSADLEQAGAALAASGELLPALNLDVTGSLSDYAQLRGRVQGQPAKPEFSADLITQAFDLEDQLRLPAQSLQLSGDIDDGLQFQIAGEALNLELTNGKLSGVVNLPISLKDDAHMLTGTVTGTPNDPELTGSLDGPLVNGPVSFSSRELRSSLALNLAPWLSDLPFDTPLATIDLRANTDLSWQADVAGRAAFRDLPLSLNAAATGQALSFSGAGTANVSDSPVPFALAGQRTAIDLSARLETFDLASLEPLLPVALDGQANGTLNYVMDSGLSFNVNAVGSAQNRAFTLNASQESGSPLQAQVVAETLQLQLQQLQTSTYSVRLTSLSEARDVNLEGVLDLSPEINLEVAGQLRERATTLSATYAPNTGLAAWQLGYDGATVSGNAARGETEAEPWLIKTDATIPQESALPLSGKASLQAQLRGSNIDLNFFDASAQLAGRDLELSLAGAAWPTPLLRGELSVDELEPFALGFSDAEQGYSIAAAQNGLELSADLSSAFTVTTFSLMGEGVLPVGPDLLLDSKLSWQASTGFRGQADLSGELSQMADLRLAFLGDEHLSVKGDVRYNDSNLIDIDLSLASDILSNPTLNGLVVVQGDLNEVVPAYSGEALGLGATLDLSGSVREPLLSGPVVLRGALTAAGEFNLVGTNGTVTLQGDGLDTQARFNASGWSLMATANDLDLSALVPQLSAARLSTELEGSQSFGSPLRLTAQPFKLTTVNSSVEGNLSYENGVQGQLKTNLDLSDLNLDSALRGTVNGQIALTTAEGAPLVSSMLSADDIGLADQNALLSGTATVNGPLTQPFVSASLNGSGSASGQLYAALNLASANYNVSSSLVIGDLQTDLNVSTEAQRISGSGNLALGDYELVFVESRPEQLILEGRSKLESWSFTAYPFDKRAELTGELSSLLSELSGKLDLEANWAAEAATPLSGTLSGVGFGPVTLGNISIAPQTKRLMGELSLNGETLDASLNLRNQDWTVERLALALPGGFEAQLEGRGTFSDARLTGNLEGELAGEPVALPVDLSYLNRHLELSSEGALLGGNLALEAVGFPDTGWRGSIKLEEGSLAGFSTDIDATLSGAFAAPELRADYQLSQAALSTKGSLTATTDAVNLSGEAASSYLEAPLNVEGKLWPEPELRLTQNGQVLELFLTEGQLDATGNLDLDAGPLRAELSEAQDGWLKLFLRSRTIEGLAFKTSLAAVPPKDLASSLGEGLFIEGAETTEGYILLSWQDRLRLSAQSLRWLTPAGAVSATGSLTGSAEGLAGRFSGAWQGNSSSRSAALPWLASVSSLIFDAELSPESLTVSAQGNGTNALILADLKAQSALLNADWQLPEGNAKLGLEYSAQTGLDGNLRFSKFPIFSSKQSGPTRLDAELTVAEGLLKGDASLRLAEGDFALEGKLGLANLLPPSLSPNRDTTQALSVKVDDFDISAVPWLANYVPYLNAPLDGFISVDQAQLAGTLTSPISIGEDIIPLDIILGGTLSEDFELNATGNFGRSSFEFSGSPDALAGLVRFEHFPLHKGFEANAGATDVRAHLTGALRFDMPDRDFRKTYLRFASEQLRIESDGVVTEGALSFEIEDQGLSIQEAYFEGEGSWVASGEASQEQLNLRIDAQDADFSPFLNLIPQLAGLNVGAFGSLQLISSGSLINPIIRATSPGLELSLSGSAYNLENLSLTVQNSDFVTSGRLEGVAPLTGSVRFSGGGQLVLAPERAFDLSLRFQGNPSLPVLGTLSDVTGTITARPGEPWRIESTGVLGQPFSVEGNLTPLDVRVAGDRLNLKARQFFLVSSETDTNLRFVWDRALFVSGSLLTHRAQLDLDSRERREGADEDREARSRGGALSRVFFQDISVRAPQELSFQENFGSGELGNINVTLGGTAATPFLNGSAEALRGTIRFAGRDFSLVRSVATFEPSQGIFPTLDIRARSSFNKTQVLNNVRDVDFIEPTGPTFELNLVLAGSLEPNRDGPRPFTVDIEPTLTSNAVIQTVNATARPLTEPELFSLLSLGRLELSQEFASQGGLATSLAQGAVDTAVDVLILSELQKELGSILGLDLLEIRTTSLSSLFTGEDNGFGVSLRVGGYLSDELFASYQIGSAGLEDGIALSNEFNLRYTLAPLDFSLVGSLDFTDTGDTVPALDLGVGYSLNPTIQLETGVQLSTENLGVRFGVNFRY